MILNFGAGMLVGVICGTCIGVMLMCILSMARSEEDQP